MKGTGRLYWKIANGDPPLGDPAFGIIVGNDGVSITIVNIPGELTLNDIDLTISHKGTLVEYIANKIPEHEVYHCSSVTNLDVEKTKRRGLLKGGINKNNRRFSGLINETSPQVRQIEIKESQSHRIVWSPPDLDRQIGDLPIGTSVDVIFQLEVGSLTVIQVQKRS